MNFDPSQFGATPVAPTSGGFNPSQFGATPVNAGSTGAAGAWQSLAASHPAANTAQPYASPGTTWQPNIVSSIANFIAGGASDLGVHLGQAAAGATAKIAGALGFKGEQAKIENRLAAGQTNMFGAPVHTLEGGTTGAKQLGGDLLKTGSELATVAAAPVTVPGALAAGAAIGASEAAGNALQQGGGAGDVAKEGLVGGITGAIGGGVASGAAKLLSFLPSRLVQSALPKLDGTNIPKVLQDTKLGTIGSMLKASQGAVSDLGGQIHSILSSDSYAAHIGDGNAAVDDALHAFPNSEYTRPDIISATKNVVPGQAALVTKLDNGTATLAEKNTLRQAIDAATKKIFTDSPQVSAQKQIAAPLASSLRAEVQSTASETKPIFAQLSKEINLRNALQTTAKKLDARSPINLYSILSFLTGGIPAALGEEFARSPATSIAAGKLAAKAAPAIQAAAPATGALASRMATGSGGNPDQQPQ